jgi:protein-S-isoprenylcysteine O-methyltransferase Ste14
MFCILILFNILERGENGLIRIIGVFILLIAIIIWVLPFIYLKKYGRVEIGRKYFETNHIVDQGIYGIIRHPQYLAYIFLVVGFTFLSQNWIILILAIITISFFYYHTVQEEKELINKFQDDYKRYCMKVPRFNFLKGIFNRI